MQGEGPSGRCLMGSLPDRSWRFSFYACAFFGGLSILYHVSVPSAGALGLDWGAWVGWGWRGSGRGGRMCRSRESTWRGHGRRPSRCQWRTCCVWERGSE